MSAFEYYSFKKSLSAQNFAQDIEISSFMWTRIKVGGNQRIWATRSCKKSKHVACKIFSSMDISVLEFGEVTACNCFCRCGRLWWCFMRRKKIMDIGIYVNNLSVAKRTEHPVRLQERNFSMRTTPDFRLALYLCVISLFIDLLQQLIERLLWIQFVTLVSVYCFCG